MRKRFNCGIFKSYAIFSGFLGLKNTESVVRFSVFLVLFFNVIPRMFYFFITMVLFDIVKTRCAGQDSAYSYASQIARKFGGQFVKLGYLSSPKRACFTLYKFGSIKNVNFDISAPLVTKSAICFLVASLKCSAIKWFCFVK